MLAALFRVVAVSLVIFLCILGGAFATGSTFGQQCSAKGLAAGSLSWNQCVHDLRGLMDRIAAGDISRLIVAHKDRLVRFGFDLLDHIAKRSACIIEVVNQESLSPQEEMTEDLLSIVHTFSCRLYGMRKYKRKND